MNRRTLAVLAIAAALALPVVAQIVIEFTLTPVTRSELHEIVILIEPSGDLRAYIVYDVLQEGGEIYEGGVTHSFILGTPQAAQLNGFINATVLPEVNGAPPFE